MRIQSYAEFVANVLSALGPVLPGGIDPKAGFSGASFPDQDSALLKGERALFLQQLAIDLEPVTGVGAALYEAGMSPATQLPMLAHAAYPKNLRRWLNGTLPRKRKARSDFVLVAACWLCCWGGEELADSNELLAAREEVLRSAGLDYIVSEGEAAPLQLAEALWALSTAAYERSLDAAR